MPNFTLAIEGQNPVSGFLNLQTQPEGEFWYLKNKKAAGGIGNGSFCAIGGMGQTYWIELKGNEKSFIRSVYPNNLLWNWAATQQGTLYIGRDDSNDTVEWPPILLSSSYTEKQIVRVLQKTSTKFLVDSIPYQSNGDYSAYTPDKHPEYWLKAFTYFKNDTYGVSHVINGVGYTFLMPLFNPVSGFRTHLDSSYKGFWIDINCFESPVLSLDKLEVMW